MKKIVSLLVVLAMVLSMVPAAFAAETTGLAITSQPVNQTVEEGATAVFTVEATGTGLTYQWQSSLDGITWGNCGLPGNTTATLSVGAIAARNGAYYRCVVTDANGESVTTNAAQLLLAADLAIVTHPATQTVEEGATAVFTVEATGTGLTYQWQSSWDGETWNNCGLPGNTTATLSVGAIAARNGAYYRCVVTDAEGNEVVSNAARLLIAADLAIITHPATQTVEEGATAVFTVEATGTGLTYQWQSSWDGETWNNCGLPGNTTATLSVGAIAARNGAYYRCVVTDADGASVTSNAAQLLIAADLAIVTHPVTQTVEEGATAVFTVEATGTGLTYQWQSSWDGETWNNCGLPGNTTATLSVGAIAARDGAYYRCVVTDANGESVTTNAAQLLLAADLAIVTHPATQTVEEGATAVFTVEATGTGLTYQWQSSWDGETWSNCGLPGNTTATLSVGAIAARNGAYYRCVVTDANGESVTTNAAQLLLAADLEIVTHPATQTVEEGATAVFTVEATGTGLTYQWQSSWDGESWSNCGLPGNTTATLSVGAIAARNGAYYRCVVSDDKGNTVTSDAAQLIIMTPGTEDYPIEIVPTEIPYSWTVDVAAGETVYYVGSSRLAGLEMTIAETGETVILEAGSDWMVHFSVSNTTDEDATYTVTLAYLVGTQSNPEALFSVNAITATLAEGDSDGYYYSWYSRADGTVTLTGAAIEGVEYDVVMTNMTTYEMAWMADSEDYTVSLEVSAGDQVIIQVVTMPDANWVYPAAEIALTGTFEYPIGTQPNPAALFSVNVINTTLAEGDSDGYYYSWYSRADGTVTLTGTAIEGVEYDVILTNMTTYEMAWMADSEDYTVSLAVSAGDQVIIQVVTMPDANWVYPAAEITLTGTFAYAVGSMENPEVIADITNADLSVAEGDEDGYYYSWTASEDGTLVLTPTAATEGVAYDIIVTNMTTYEMVWLSECDGSMTLEVSEGDVLLIQLVVVPDADWNYFAADVTVAGSFTSAPDENETPFVPETGDGSDEDETPVAPEAGSGENETPFVPAG